MDTLSNNLITVDTRANHNLVDLDKTIKDTMEVPEVPTMTQVTTSTALHEEGSQLVGITLDIIMEYSSLSQPNISIII